jgi:hypothetical protein
MKKTKGRKSRVTVSLSSVRTPYPPKWPEMQTRFGYEMLFDIQYITSRGKIDL